jgi:hypothetical protein
VSRYYEMSVEIKAPPSKLEAIKTAANGEWNFGDDGDDWYTSDGTISAAGRSNLTGGESEEEFSDRLMTAIWKANGAYCEVTVRATYLEELPYETYTGEQEKYEKLVELGIIPKKERKISVPKEE